MPKPKTIPNPNIVSVHAEGPRSTNQDAVVAGRAAVAEDYHGGPSTLAVHLQSLSVDDNDDKTQVHEQAEKPGGNLDGGAVAIDRLATGQVIGGTEGNQKEISERRKVLASSSEKQQMKDWRDPTAKVAFLRALPLEDIDTTAIKTLLDLSLVSIPKAPPCYKKGALEGTKQVSRTEIKLLEQQKLRKVVFAPSLISQLIERLREKLDALTLEWGKDVVERAVANIHSWHTMAHLPEKIWSETDVVLRAHAIIFRPAMAIVEILERSNIVHDHAWTIPYVSSCAHIQGVFPDGQMVCQDGLSMVFEMKTPTVFKTEDGDSKFAELLKLESEEHLGRTYKFSWPNKIPDNDTQTRMLVQIWSQLVVKEVRLKTFSTSEITIFMVRGTGDEEDTLFISPEYRREDCPILATAAWFALGAGQLDINDLVLPDVDTKWWKDQNAIEQFEATGIAPACLYSNKRQLTARQESLEAKKTSVQPS